MHRPRIGLSTYLETASWGVWARPAALVPRVYLDAVTRSGGQPLLIPPGAADESLVELLDGLVIVGGADVDPASYGAVPDPATEGAQPERDEHERRLILAALAEDLPTLGVCRGAQVMTTALGGTLHQHLPDLLDHEEHRPQPGIFGSTTISTTSDSLVEHIMGAEAKVLCHHHQGLANVAAPLVATGWSDDGLVEAVELPSASWVLGVQWHPEENPDDLRLFRGLVDAARARRESRPWPAMT